ncbi:MAG TPA: hypothetical protein VKT82_25645 [Ktedonobacterales bacterium]|nr:hypothetical protein [Ktedonobacterales bacterium]
MSQAGQNQSGAVSLDLLSVGIVVLTISTALIHFLLALSIGPPGLAPFPLLFYLNAIGYVVLLIAYFAPSLFRLRRPIRWLLTLYAALTFALWFVLNKHHDAEGYLDKVLAIALIILLVVDDRRATQARSELSPAQRR